MKLLEVELRGKRCTFDGAHWNGDTALVRVLSVLTEEFLEQPTYYPETQVALFTFLKSRIGLLRAVHIPRTVRTSTVGVVL